MEQYRVLSRVWRAHLTPSEMYVLLYLLDQTVGIGHLTRTFTVRGMMRGGDKACGLQMKERTLREHVKSLENKQFILVHPDKSTGFTITVNLHWQEEDVLPTPKRLQQKLSEEVGSDQEGWEDPGENLPDPLQNSAAPPGEKLPDPPAEIRRTLKEAYFSTNIQKQSSGDCESTANAGSAMSGEGLEKSSGKLSLPVRKRKRPGSFSETQNFETGCKIETEPENTLPVRTRPRPPAEDLAEHAEQKRLQARQKTNPGALQATWKAACAEHYSEIPGLQFPTWTREDLFKLKSSVCQRWQGTPEELHEFVEFIVANWSQLMEKHFHWCTKPAAPSTPDVRFLIRFALRFIGMWNDRASLEWINQMPRGDQRRYHELTKREGLGHEAAVLQIAKDKAARETRDEVDKKLAEAKHHHNVAHRLEQQTRNKSAPVPVDRSHRQLELEKKEREIEDLKRQLAEARDQQSSNDGQAPLFDAPEWDDDIPNWTKDA